MQLIAVVLPDPLGPRSPKISPLADGEVQVVERDELAVALDEPGDADDVG